MRRRWHDGPQLFPRIAYHVLRQRRRTAHMLDRRHLFPTRLVGNWAGAAGVIDANRDHVGHENRDPPPVLRNNPARGPRRISRAPSTVPVARSPAILAIKQKSPTSAMA